MISSIKQGFYQSLDKFRGIYEQDPRKQFQHRAIFYTILLGIVLMALTVGGLFMVTYGDKAAPATYLSGVDVSGKTRYEIKILSKTIFDKFELTLRHETKTILASAADLGITLRDDDSAVAAIEVGTSRNIFVRFNPFWKKEASLAVDIDYLQMQELLNQEFTEVTIVPKDTTIVFNETSAQFDVMEGKSGRVVSAENIGLAIEEMLMSKTSAIFDVDLVDAGSNITIAAAERARDYMNLRVDLRLNMNYNGRLLYFIDPPDIAAWADIVPNPKTGEIDIEFDKAKIKMFLTNKLAPSIAMAPVDKKILIDKTGKELLVVQHGQRGRQPRDFEQLVDKVYDATVAGVGLEQELDLVEADFKIVRIEVEDVNWIEVNLSNQTAMLWNGTQLLQTFLISSGVANYPTVTGEFRIWYKTVSQTMTGGSRADGSYYNLPGVTWVSYFYQDYAFHTKYWNNIYGVPSSHGCINMREADAKILYDFAPIGTRVVVHY